MDTNTNDKIRGILTTEVKFVIAIVVFVFGVVSPYFQMREDISLIKKDISNINSNHEVHIQDLNQNIKELLTSQNVQNDKIIELQEAIIRLQK